jgi:hypothetical protein
MSVAPLMAVLNVSKAISADDQMPQSIVASLSDLNPVGDIFAVHERVRNRGLAAK